MPSEEELMLAFKEQGVEFVEDAGKAIGGLGDKMEDVNKAQAAAIEVLKEGGTVVEDLKEKIRKYKVELEGWSDAAKAGLIPLDKYSEQSGKLVEVIRESETVLKRLTASEREREQIADEVETSLIKEAEAQAKVATAAASAAAKIEEQTRAEQLMADIAGDVETSLAQVAGQGDLESGTGGLKGVAGGAIKAERAIKELVEGRGLMRLGSQLEGVIPLLGGPAGMGLAIGAIVVAVHDVIPAMKKWFDTWQDGGKVMQDTTKALKDFDVAQKSIHDDMRKHALHEVDKQIEVLEAEDRETKAAGLPEYNKEDLKRLRSRSTAGHKLEKQQKEFAGVGRTQAQRKMSTAVKEAIEEAGGVDAVIGEDANDAARYILQSAMDGDRESIETLKQWSPEFAAMWQAVDPDVIRAIKRKEAGAKTIADVQTKTAKNIEHRDKQVDHAMESTMRSDEAFNKKREHDRLQSERQAEQQSRKNEAEARRNQAKAERDARENTPEHLTHAEAAAQGQAIMGEERTQNKYRADMGATPFDPGELEQVKHKAMQAMPAARARGMSLGQLVSWAMAMQADEIEQGLTQGLGHHARSAQNTNPLGGY